MKKSGHIRNKKIANFFFEAGILGKTLRSWTFFSGSQHRNVAEHTNRVIYIGLTLAKLHGHADPYKVMLMCAFHDFAEARTSDLNYVHQKYVERNDKSAIIDFTSSLPFGEEIKKALDEYEERKTIESQLTKDADALEWLLTVKEENDLGNKIVDNLWLSSAYKRIKSDIAKEIADEILVTRSDDWWTGDKNDEWWITRTKKNEKKEKK